MFNSTIIIASLAIVIFTVIGIIGLSNENLKLVNIALMGLLFNGVVGCIATSLKIFLEDDD